jgi:transcriptional regulator GlxA family with amidase domain
MSEVQPKRLGVVLFPEFELLDVFGPVEMFGNLKGWVEVVTVAEKAGAVVSAQDVRVVADHGFSDCPRLDYVLVPGGIGTRAAVDDENMMAFIRKRVADSELAMTVCTGTALFARAGVLDGHKATTNKMAFQWVADQGPKVEWIKQARWVEDGKFATSSGVSAGMDMALAVIERIYGKDITERLATATEYDRHTDASWDPFAKIHGLV